MVAAAAVTITPALAADLQRPVVKAPVYEPVWNWTGFYIGANGGGGWGRKCWDVVVPSLDLGCHDVSGPLAGGQVGFNWQNGRFVLGAELSGDWANLKGHNVPSVFPAVTDDTHITSLATATVRAGVTWDRALLYVKGGGAWVHEKYFHTCLGVIGQAVCLPVGATPLRASETRTGWTIGGGVEYALTPNLSAAVEYGFADFGTSRNTFTVDPGYTCIGGVLPCRIDITQHVSTVTARLNWRFGGPLVARY